ncbi:hypothetical protein D3C81_799110 [compost metagenome]
MFCFNGFQAYNSLPQSKLCMHGFAVLWLWAHTHGKLNSKQNEYDDKHKEKNVGDGNKHCFIDSK